MSKIQILRCIVNERLTAAAEEIFALFERTITEYEAELCRSKEENQRKQQLLDSVVCPRVPLHRAGVLSHLMSAGPSLNQEITETLQMKAEPEEQSIKQEEDDQLQEFTIVSVKSEEQSSPLQQRQSEHREETQGEDCGGAEVDINSDPPGHFHSETEEHSDNEEDWESPPCSSTQQMETEAGGDHYNQVTSVQNSNLISHLTFRDGDLCNVPFGFNRNECSFCRKICKTKQDLQKHTRVHTGEKPYSCSICRRTFSRNSHLKQHMRTHTGEKPYSCSICKKTFTQKNNFKTHMNIHTGEKPYSCTICNKTFNQRSNLKKHVRTHTGEKSYSCTMCDKTFARNDHLKKHMNTHTGEIPFNIQENICTKQ